MLPIIDDLLSKRERLYLNTDAVAYATAKISTWLTTALFPIATEAVIAKRCRI